MLTTFRSVPFSERCKREVVIGREILRDGVVRVNVNDPVRRYPSIVREVVSAAIGGKCNQEVGPAVWVIRTMQVNVRVEESQKEVLRIGNEEVAGVVDWVRKIKQGSAVSVRKPKRQRGFEFVDAH